MAIVGIVPTADSALASCGQNDVLKELQKLRQDFKGWEKNRDKMKDLVARLVEKNVYPKMGANGTISAFKMMENYGAYWYMWTAPFNCPHCGSNLRDKKNGPPFKREIGQYSQSLDRTVGYQCPDCKEGWPRK